MPPSERPPSLAPLPPPAWRLNLALFLATVVSVFGTSLAFERSAAEASARADGALPKVVAFVTDRVALAHAGAFTLTLLGILTAHELGHFIASRIHRVDATLPFFIPMPLLSPFGTMGAVIRMRGTIATRRALLDIGASGPLAGLALALPLYAYGAARSHVVPIAQTADSVELGESLIVKLLDHLAHPGIPEGSELFLSPIAFGAWAGMFVTMINLLPVGQLDGGHVAYALFGPKQDRFARFVHRALPVLFFLRLAQLVLVDVAGGRGLARFGAHLGSALFWLVWFEMLAILGKLSPSDVEAERPARPTLTVRARVVWTLALVMSSGYLRAPDELPALVRRIGVWPAYVAWFLGLFGLLVAEARRGVFQEPALLAHPPTGAAPLDAPRAVVAVLTLLFFVGLFMPTPIAM
ncbi:MAG TPA: site-2 protease family protein [Polyangiaceae bacterium]|nr:site-2 protease family protein [Polyangiaceae bacterium]